MGRMWISHCNKNMTTAKTSASTAKAADTDSAKSKGANGNAMDKQISNELSKLDQIRDMLFGEQVSALHEQFKLLDKNLNKNISALYDEMKSSIADLRQSIEKDLDKLQKRVSSEEEQRAGQDEELNTAIANINSDILTKIDLETKRIDEALDQQHKESVHQLNEVTDSLQNKKVDKKTLAKFLNEFANELGGS